MRASEIEEILKNIVPERAFKGIGDHNPIMTQRFGADPFALVYDGRVYLYMTGDTPYSNEEGELQENHYSNIYTINVVSSADMVNWTDHGSIYAASEKGAATWGNNSWAPAAAYKLIDGKHKFFLYFANSGNGIAVLTSDSPIGPFTDPLKKPLVSRETPTCSEVTWLFDPAVLVDEDGTGYLYFGGGIPSPDKTSNPGTARVAKLSADMIHIEGEPVPIVDVPYLFEDSGINKIGDTYYYSYCSNFSVPRDEVDEIGFDSGEIIVMAGKNPMGPFTLCGPILKNMEYYFGRGGNNHHCMFQFKNQWYMSYHTRLLEEAMGMDKGYRSTNIDLVQLNEDETIAMIQATKKGVEQTVALNPYNRIPAVTMANMAGIQTTQFGKISEAYGSGEMIVTGIHTGSWIAVYGVDFGAKHPKEFTVSVRGTGTGLIKISTDSLEGVELGVVKIESESPEIFREITILLEKKITGIHDLYFLFGGEGFEIRSWFFSE